jgi:sugar/nucleoside kinase (ribokinase family)
VIAVIGIPRLRGEDTDADVAGLAASIATAAAAADSRVELVGKVGDDAAGDAVLLALGRHGVGHVATLRDPARATPIVAAGDDDPDDQPPAGQAAGPAPVLDAGDVGLALRYLPELGVIVTVHVGDDVVDEAASAAGWARTTLIVVVLSGAAAPDGLPPGALALAVDEVDELGGAGAAIGRFAAALDQGAPADAAYAELVAAGEAPSRARG